MAVFTGAGGENVAAEGQASGASQGTAQGGGGPSGAGGSRAPMSAIDLLNSFAPGGRFAQNSQSQDGQGGQSQGQQATQDDARRDGDQRDSDEEEEPDQTLGFSLTDELNTQLRLIEDPILRQKLLSACIESQKVYMRKAEELGFVTRVVGKKPDSGVSPPEKRRTFSLADEAVHREAEVPVVLPKGYDLLFQDGRHLPLSLFLASSIKEINLQPTSFLHKSPSLVTGKNMQFIKTDDPRIPKEASLSASEWSEAAMRWLIFLAKPFADGVPKVSHEVLARWQNHVEMIRSHPMFHQSVIFRALRAHDIAERMLYFAGEPFAYDASLWQQRLQSRITEVQINDQAVLLETTRQQGSRGGFQRGESRFGPYDKPRFERSRSDAGPSRNRGQICFLCGELGHRAQHCSSQRTRFGGPIICRFAKGPGLPSIRQGEKHSFRLNFNARGAAAECSSNSHGNDVRHACSVCGSSSHHAAAGACAPAQ